MSFFNELEKAEKSDSCLTKEECVHLTFRGNSN